MNLRKIDLNLLVYFDVLIQTRHVSRAAERLGVRQSAMSAALGRLRELFDDPLLVRQGHEMVPTRRALQLETEVRNVLREIENVIEPPSAFDPAVSERGFRVRMSDLLTFLMLQDFVQILESQGPGLKLTIDHLSPDQTTDALVRDEIDVAISTGLEVPKSVLMSKIYRDSVVCLARPDLKVKKQLASAESFAALPKVRVSQSPLDHRFADQQLSKMGLKRNVSITVPHWLAVPDILCATSLVAAVPASFAKRVVEKYPLCIHKLDVFENEFDWSLYWHSRYHNDPAHKWFRDQLMASGARQFGKSAKGPGK